MSDDSTIPGEQFISNLTACQTKLLGYITAAVGSAVVAHDVLQQTNLSLWRNFANFDPERPFLPWALTLARFQVLSFYRDRRRDRLVFDPDVLDYLLDRTEEKLASIPRRQVALRECLTNLKEDHRTLLTLYYAHRKSVTQISELTGRSEDGVKCLMMRLRRLLRDCIQRKVPTT